MLVNRSFDEIRVYDGMAERTGVQFDWADVRRSAGYCSSLTELHRKVRSAGDGCFYLPLNSWPVDVSQLNVQKRWVVM
jgi:hypothetical protein